MIRFKEAKHPAALSYAAASSGPKRVDATLVWKLERKNRLLEHENRMLWTMLGLFWACWVVSLVATLWLMEMV